MRDEMSPLPSQVEGDILARLTEARRDATHAVLEAEREERKARDLRRKASQKMRRYERMVQEYNGQEKLPGM